MKAAGLGALAVVTITVPASRALGEHEHGTGEDLGGPSAFSAGVGVALAAFDTRLYGGDYQSVTPTVRWHHTRFTASANVPYYWLTKNGQSDEGPGDALVQGSLSLHRAGRSHLGVTLAVALPTGDDRSGLGMGHVMVMPTGWIAHTSGTVTVVGSAGYGHALGDHAHVHAAWPLVDPMNRAEVTWLGGVELELARALRVGTRLHGALPVEDAGTTRTIGGVQAAWTEGRVVTTAAVQVGITGDPFTMRGLVETSVRF